MKTIKEFAAKSHISEKLIRAVIAQCGGFAAFKDLADDVTNYGAGGGFSGFIYYSDTCSFYAKNQAEIVALVKQLSDDLKESIIEMVCSFGCLKGYANSEEVGQTLYGSKRKHDTQVANGLAWFALEEVARSYVDLSDE